MDFRRLDLNLLIVLDALFAERSVTAAARRLKVSQPTVSFSLGKLRGYFQDELFVRENMKMVPTPFAETIHGPIRRIVETISVELLHDRSFDPATTERTFSFSMSDIGELVFLPALLQTMRARAPSAALQCLSLPPIELAEALANGAVDIALGYFPDLQNAAFYQQGLFDHPFSCILRKDHPTVGDSLSLDEFLALEHIVIAQKGRSQEIAESRMSELAIDRQIKLRSPHFNSVPMILSQSDMVCIVPRAVGRAHMRAAKLKLVEPPIDIPSIPLKQFWHRRVHADPAVVWLRGLVAEIFLNKDPSASLSSPIFGD